MWLIFDSFKLYILQVLTEWVIQFLTTKFIVAYQITYALLVTTSPAGDLMSVSTCYTLSSQVSISKHQHWPGGLTWAIVADGGLRRRLPALGMRDKEGHCRRGMLLHGEGLGWAGAGEGTGVGAVVDGCGGGGVCTGAGVRSHEGGDSSPVLLPPRWRMVASKRSWHGDGGGGEWVPTAAAEKEMKIGKWFNPKGGYWIYTLNYQQRFYMEPLLKLVYQQRFIGKTVIDIPISASVVPMNRCWWTINSGSSGSMLNRSDNVL
jgi:hypothetical protein